MSDGAPRLRFDKVAVRLVRSVCDAVGGAVPDGRCVLFAVTAPIREPGRTIAALVETIRARITEDAFAAEIYGNLVRVRVVANVSRPGVTIAGFVHNPAPSPDALLDMMQVVLGGGDAPEAGALQRDCERVLGGI